MLELLPPPPEEQSTLLWINRYHAAARAQGVEIPGDDATTEDLLAFYGSLQA